MASAIARSQHPISVEEYLEGERFSEVRHEFVAGRVYAMAGASVDHNRITLNLLAELREQLRGKRCEPFGSDMKLKMPGSEAFYYPDALVTCDPSDDAKYFREKPAIVFEVLSEETERTDQREKRFAYSLIPSLKVYVLISQEKREVMVLRRGRAEQWVSESVTGRGAVLELPEIKVEIPLTRIYERTAAARLKA